MRKLKVPETPTFINVIEHFCILKGIFLLICLTPKENTLARFRWSILDLQIEKGSHTNIDRDLRYCNLISSHLTPLTSKVVGAHR